MPPFSDGTEVPANRAISEAERAARLAECFQPYHDAIEVCIAAAPHPPAIVSIHSFTPSMSGFQRPWQIGVLWNEDKRIATPLMASLAAKGVAVGDNQPYSARDPHGYTLPAHAESRDLPHVLIEIRQDLIHEQDFRLDGRGDGKGEANQHTRRVVANRHVEELAQLAEVGDCLHLGPDAPRRLALEVAAVNNVLPAAGLHLEAET